MSRRLYPPPAPSRFEPFDRRHHDAVRRLERHEAEALLRRHVPQVAGALIATWPKDEAARGIALAALLGVASEHREKGPDTCPNLNAGQSDNHAGGTQRLEQLQLTMLPTAE